MDRPVVVASQSFGARYQALMYGHLRRGLEQGGSIKECRVIRPNEPDFLRQCLLAELRTSVTPLALIGICLQPDPQTVAEFRSAGVPVVLIDEEVEGASTVACDNLAGGYLVGEHLARTGRRSVAVVAGPSKHYNAANRVSGLARALREHRLMLPNEAIIEAPTYVRKEGEAAMTRLLREEREVDAVFSAAGDTCALGILSVAREAGLKIPMQLAVIGFDDIPLASISDPPLTTVRQPFDAIAREALRLATRCAAEILAQPQRKLVEPSLVVRSSG